MVVRLAARLAAAIFIAALVLCTVVVKPANADDVCRFLAIMPSLPSEDAVNHMTNGDVYFACALSLSPKDRQAFDMYQSAANEYSTAAQQSERLHNNDVLTFVYYVKAYDIFTTLLLINHNEGYGSEDNLRTLRQTMSQGIRRTSRLALPQL